MSVIVLEFTDPGKPNKEIYTYRGDEMKTEFAVLASFENYIGIRTQITVERSIESESYARILGERFKRPESEVGCRMS